MANRYFGGAVRGYMEDKSLSILTKVFTLSIMWISAILTSVFLIKRWWIIVILMLISVGVTWHILSFPTKKRLK